jgi:hypothetical protein
LALIAFFVRWSPSALAPRTEPDAALRSVATPPATITTARSLALGQLDRQTLDPSRDGWDSEAFAELALAQLKELGQLIEHPNLIEFARFERLASARFASGSLRPAHLDQVFADRGTTVWRGELGNATDQPDVYRGPAGLGAALGELARLFHDTPDVQTHFKIIRVETSDNSTTVLLEASGYGSRQTLQQNATWTCTWERPSDGPPRLESIRIVDYQQAVTNGHEGRWFVDSTGSVLGHNRSFQQQLLYGLDHWMQRIERLHRMDESVRTGLAIGDVNADGLDDVYVCQGPGLPNLLYVQNEDGTATDRSSEAGVDWLDSSTSALIVDLDNDGDQDLAVATTSGILMMANDGRGRFQLKSVLADVGIDVQSLSACDYDEDRYLDIYACVYRPDPAPPGSPVAPFVYHDNNHGGENCLFRNEIPSADPGTWRFRNVTRECGLDAKNHRYSLAASWEDYDNDHDLDLYVANDYGRNCLYRNDGGRFVEIAEEAGVVDMGPGMSVSWGDYDRDGRMDLYVGNMFSTAGQRVTRQQQFRADDEVAQLRDLYLRFAQGNSLFSNGPDGFFRDVSAAADVQMGRWAWSSLLVDLNNDGWEDILIANGYITTEDSGDL